MIVVHRLLPLVAATALISSIGWAESPETLPASYGPPIAVADAGRIVDRGMKLAAAKGFKMAFAVVEPSGELVAFARMDDTPYASIKVAQQKARSSARFRLPTAEFQRRVLAGRTVLLSSDEVLAVGGGIPIVAGGRVIGALGVSGGSAAEDSAIASAAITGR